jgi:hypothetical protein
VSAYQRSGLDKIPLPDSTKGEPPGENQPALPFSGTRYLGQQGMLSPRDSPFGTSDVPLLFLLGWRTFPSSWRSGFGQALPDLPAGRQATGGHPKGLGLEGIRGASYAFDVPAKQNGFHLRFGGTHAATTTDN